MDRRPDRLMGLPSLLLNLASSHGNRLVRQHLRELGRQHLGDLDRRVSYAALAALEEFGPSSQAELSRRTGIDRSDMVSLVIELERDRLVTKRPDSTDRRRNSIVLTAAGRRRLAALDTQVRAAQVDLLEPLDAREQAELIGLLQRLVSHHDRSPVSTRAEPA